MSSEKIVASFHNGRYSVHLINDDGDRFVQLVDRITPYTALLSVSEAAHLDKLLEQAVDSCESMSLQEIMAQFQKRFPVGTRVIPREPFGLDGSNVLTVLGHCVRFGVIHFVFGHKEGGSVFSTKPAQQYIHSDGGSNV